MFLYLPIKENLDSDELGSYITFGIKVLNSFGEEVTAISDVSLEKVVVTEICDKCTANQLEPIHLLDVIEDYI